MSPDRESIGLSLTASNFNYAAGKLDLGSPDPGIESTNHLHVDMAVVVHHERESVTTIQTPLLISIPHTDLCLHVLT